jgi:hypothetical protein
MGEKKQRIGEESTWCWAPSHYIIFPNKIFSYKTQIPYDNQRYREELKSRKKDTFQKRQVGLVVL